MRVLLNGLSAPVQGYPALIRVNSELDAIEQMYGGRRLQNETFREAEVREELADHEYSIVHFATHGQFTGKVEDSYLLTWDGRIGMDDLEQSVGASWFRDDRPVELLTLSACDSAAGDDNAALGLASIAIRAGARSALASLWAVNDQASSELVAGFYRQLLEPGVSKAGALQQAQLSLLDDLRYRHPGYWAPFVLIGNWL
jgi:CHAT domain-containing protein